MYKIDFLDIPPLNQAGGEVLIPGSKSISNRALLMAALCPSPTQIKNFLEAEDTAVLLAALRQLGCVIQTAGSDVVIERGLLAALQVAKQPQQELFLANAGTAFRSLTAVLAVLGVAVKLSGVARMHQRPIADLVEALRSLGCQIDYSQTAGYPPLQIKAFKPTGQTSVKVKGNISSQFLTALLMALPLLAKQQSIEIAVVGELISKPYVEITLQMLQQFGIRVSNHNWQCFSITKGAQYQSPGEFLVEPDASSASYFAAMGAIAARQRPIELIGLTQQALQGDIKFLLALEQMGAKVVWCADRIKISQAVFPLRAIDLDCNHIPDAAMTLASLALFANGTTILRNIGSWRVKETDRLSAMASELVKVGAKVTSGTDFLAITAPTNWTGASLATYNDHRMAMSLSLLAFNSAAKVIRLNNPACVTKTFPDYFETMFQLVKTPVANIPVICIDGPTASGKGTLSSLLAQQLGYAYLDSGCLYRLLALAAQKAGVLATDAVKLLSLVQGLEIKFSGSDVYLAGQLVTAEVRSEAVGLFASKIAAIEAVRQQLLQLQRNFCQLPGLVADGRDMGTVVFPHAKLKIFLTASAEERAQRRFNQLKNRQISVTLSNLFRDLQERDRRDRERAVAPLVAAPDAVLLDNSAMTIEQSVQWVKQKWLDLAKI